MTRFIDNNDFYSDSRSAGARSKAGMPIDMRRISET